MLHLTNQILSLAWLQIWQVSILIAVVALFVRLFGRSRPHLAYLLWMMVVIKCVTPPLWSSPTGVFCWAPLNLAMGQDATQQDGSRETLWQVGGGFFGDGPASSSVDSMPVSDAETHFGSVLAPIIGSIWLIGAFLLAGIVVLNWLACRRKLTRSSVPTDRMTQTLVDELASRLGLRLKVRFTVTSEPFGPVLFGVLRPTIYVPQVVLRGKAREQLEPILAHELIHLRRGDALNGLLQFAAQVLWWFHPLVWWANRQLCRERERCCDEEVLAGLGCRPAVYARCLLDVLEQKQELRPVMAFPGVRPAEVTSRRLENIMKHTNPFLSRTPRGYWLVLLVGCILFLPGAAKSQSAQDRNDESSPTLGSGLIFKLPKDGTWAAFDYHEDSHVNGDGQRLRKGKLFISSVGRSRVGDDDCRWIEFRFDGTRNGLPYTWIDKVLIPEKYLVKGEKLADHIVRGWQQYGDEVREAKMPLLAVFLPAWLAGLADVKQLDPEVVDSKLGKLECEGLTGTTAYTWRYGQHEYDQKGTQVIRLHDNAPFGVVSINIDTKSTLAGKIARTGTFTLKLSDFGVDGKSKLPDHN